jgi:hypothetical protein
MANSADLIPVLICKRLSRVFVLWLCYIRQVGGNKQILSLKARSNIRYQREATGNWVFSGSSAEPALQ